MSSPISTTIGRRPATRSTTFCAAAAPDAFKRRVAGVSFVRLVRRERIPITHQPAFERTHQNQKDGQESLTMISQRQIGFRQDYRSRILGWYHGYVHVVIIYAMGAAAFYVYVAHLHAITALEWLTVPLTFL